MFITLCVIAYNEEKCINSILNDISNQDYDHGRIEVLLVDGMSTDNTKACMEDFKEKYKDDFSEINIYDNPGKTLPCGWNVALKNFKGEAILKVDAHASIPQDFVSKNVAALDGEFIVGGQRPNIIDDSTPWKETLLLAESSMFGSSIAPYRNNPGKTYVNSMFHAAYRREVFERVGLFNENLARTEDNEMHYRMRKAGFRLLFDPNIISYQHTRNSLGKMLKQKYANGYWIGITAGVCPKCLSLYHFVPFAFVVAIILSTISLVLLPFLKTLHKITEILTIIMWALYGMLAVGMSVVAAIGAGRKRNGTCFALPFLFLSLHLSYGIGTLVGFINLPRWLKGLNNKNGRK